MLLFMDGMAHYDTSRMAVKWTSVDSTYVTWSVAAEGRTGNCIKRVSTYPGNPAGFLTIVPLTNRLGPWAATASGVCGFALKIDDLSQLDNSTVVLANTILRIVEGPSYHVRVQLNRDGTFTLIQNIGSAEGGSGATILAHSTEGLQSNAWAYVEFKWLIDAAVGTFTIKVNSITVLSYTGNTRENEALFNSIGIWNAIQILDLKSI